MTVVSFNVNGIRSAIKKGFLCWLKEQSFDIVCLQEIKAVKKDVDCLEIEKMGYRIEWFSAQKKGYSGVAVFSRKEINRVVRGNGYKKSDFEGRVLEVEFNNFLLINTYFPSGSSGDERQNYKYQFLDEYLKYLTEKKLNFENIVVVGDYNIAHRPVDIHDPVANKNSSGFLIEERNWLDNFFDLGFIDSFRFVNPHPNQYTWWSYRGQARINNKGWRIDYCNVSKSLKSSIVEVKILNEVFFSDHCPVLLELNI